MCTTFANLRTAALDFLPMPSLLDFSTLQAEVAPLRRFICPFGVRRCLSLGRVIGNVRRNRQLLVVMTECCSAFVIVKDLSYLLDRSIHLKSRVGGVPILGGAFLRWHCHFNGSLQRPRDGLSLYGRYSRACGKFVRQTCCSNCNYSVLALNGAAAVKTALSLAVSGHFISRFIGATASRTPPILCRGLVSWDRPGQEHAPSLVLCTAHEGWRCRRNSVIMLQLKDSKTERKFMAKLTDTHVFTGGRA
jgi:hypothetical protein